MRNAWSKRENRYGWLFALPWMIGLIIYYAYPLATSLFLSFTSYSILKPGQFLGMQNYRDLVHDKLFWQAVSNTVSFALTFVPISIGMSLGLAALLQLRIKGSLFYRTLFFLPSLVPLIAKSLIWLSLLNPQFGLINGLLSELGITGPAWLNSEDWSKPALAFLSIWGIGNTMVILLAGLQDIPKSYYDAAEVDGAGRVRTFLSITIPLLSPVLLYNLIVGLIGTLQMFALPYSLTNGSGSPAGSMMFYVMYLYQHAFLYLHMGYASAMAWLLFLITVLLTSFVFISSRKWVHYE